MVQQLQLAQMQSVPSETLEDWGPVTEPLGDTVAHTRGIVVSNDEPQIEMGIWECSPGTWVRQAMDPEFTTFLKGSASFTPESGPTFHIRAGDVVYWPANSRGIWEIHETLRKTFVILKDVGGTQR